MPQEMEVDLLACLQIGDTTDPLAAETVPIAENMEPVIPLNLYLDPQERHSYWGRQSFMDSMAVDPYRAHMATYQKYPS